MAQYVVSGKTAASAATAGLVLFQIWNPSTTKRIKVSEIHIFKTAAGAADEPVMRRSTARGTAGSTVTPGSVHQTEQIAAPPSGFLLDLNVFSVAPTLAAGELYGAALAGSSGAGLMWSFSQPIEVNSATGLAIVTGTALAFPASRVTVVVED